MLWQLLDGEGDGDVGQEGFFFSCLLLFSDIRILVIFSPAMLWVSKVALRSSTTYNIRLVVNFPPLELPILHTLDGLADPAQNS